MPAAMQSSTPAAAVPLASMSTLASNRTPSCEATSKTWRPWGESRAARASTTSRTVAGSLDRAATISLTKNAFPAVWWNTSAGLRSQPATSDATPDAVNGGTGTRRVAPRRDSSPTTLVSRVFVPISSSR
jgi:hypothetical protein